MLKDLYLVLTGRLSSAHIEELKERVLDFRRQALGHSRLRAEAIEQRDNLIQLLLQVDEDTFRLSQCSSAEEMQSILGPMADQAMARRKHESDRVGDEVIERLKTKNMRRLEQHP